MKIYEVFDHDDMAMSDKWFPTKAAALRHVKDTYTIIGPICKNENGDLEWESEESGTVVLAEFELNPTREDICHALTKWPNR